MAQINKPSEHFNTKLYSGNGSTQSITSVGFKPDWIWIKARSGTYATENHNVYDSSRGATTILIPNGTSGNSTDANSVTSFDTDGFSMGARGDINGASTEYASWNFKANGGTTSSNTDGSVTSTVQVNSTAGFSIVTFTAPSSGTFTFGHGLGVAPSSVWLKRTDTTQNWITYWKNLGAGEFLQLNTSNASLTNANMFQNTHPTSSVFYLNTSEIGTSGTYVAYCFAEKKSYSKVGKYTGNGSSDGTFIYTGFKPAWVILRGTASGRFWVLTDNERNTYNPVNKALFSNSSQAEYTGYDRDFTSTGFKLRTSEASHNASGYSYYYLAIAEQPLVGTNNIPCTAR